MHVQDKRANPQTGGRKAVQRDAGKLTEEVLNEKEDFEVILIGLDGGIKLQRTELLTKEDLFKITDSMPMRRDELTKKCEKYFGIFFI